LFILHTSFGSDLLFHRLTGAAVTRNRPSLQLLDHLALKSLPRSFAFGYLSRNTRSANAARSIALQVVAFIMAAAADDEDVV
jgi:hypothetical protein